MNDRSGIHQGRMLINGELVESESGNWLSSLNPANEEIIGRIPAASAADVHRAYLAAEAAQPAWAAMTPLARGGLLRKVAQAMRERK